MADGVTIDRSMLARLACEAVGTFTLVFAGMLAILTGGSTLAVAFAHGLAIAVMASATMSISGGHLNPAVTFGAWIGRHIKGRDALLYVAAQVVAALVAALLVHIAIGGGRSIAAGVPAVAPTVSMGRAILVEAALTFFLVFVVYGTGIDPRFGARLGGLAIGLTVALDILAGGAFTGAAMNPARWLGPAIANGDLSGWLVYTLGPLPGAALAALLWRGLLTERKAPAEAPRSGE